MRRFEFRDGKSAKFWEVGVEGQTVTTKWGRIGANGQTKSKELADEDAAAALAAKQIAEKISKGYAEIGIAPVDDAAAPALAIASIPQDKPPVSVAVPSAPGHGLVLGIASDGDHVVAVGGQGRDLFLSSLDGGKTFRPMRSPGKGLRGAFVRGNDVWTCGEWGYVGHSPDRGETWEVVSVAAKACLFGIVADRNGVMWVAGDDGFVACSKDGRKFKTVKGLTEPIGRISAGPQGVLIPTDMGRLYLATDAGFEDLGVRAPGYLMKPTVTPCGSTIVVGNDAIFRAPAGGDFEKVAGDYAGLLCGVTSFDDGRVVVVGQSGQIWASYDDAQSFERIPQALSTNYLWCVERVYDTLLVGGHDGVVLRVGLAADRAPNPLPPLPAELRPKDDTPENPLWIAPAPSTEAQKWEPPQFELERHNGIFVSPKLRFMLYPRRGGLDVGTRPLPTAEEAWAAFRRAAWATDQSYIDAKQERSRIWQLVTSNDALDRTVGGRLLDPAVRTVSAEADGCLYRRVMGRYDGIVHQYDRQVYDRLADLFAATNGLAEGIRRALVMLDELPYVGVGPFGRFRELLAIADDETYAEARTTVLQAIQSRLADVSVKEAAAMHWAATFMFPLGPQAGEVEAELHERALRELGDYGNSRVHAAGIAAGGVDTLERYMAAQRNQGARHQFFGPFNYRMYLTSVLELDGAAAADVFARLKPQSPFANDPFYNGVWCSLLGHIDSPIALEALYREYENPPGDTWALACLTESAKLDADRVLDFVRAKGADELADEIESHLTTEMPPNPVDPPDDVLFVNAGKPSHYVPPVGFRPEIDAPSWAPATVFAWDDDARNAAIDQRPYDDYMKWNGVPISACSADQLEAFVTHRETWGIPTQVGLLASVPTRFHARLAALGIDLADWSTVRFLAPVLIRGGVSHVAILAAALANGSMLEGGLMVARSVGDVRLVPSVTRAFAGKKNKAAATFWLLRFPRHAAAGAVQMLAAEPKDKDAPRVLRFLAARGHRAVVEQFATQAEIAPAVAELLDTDPLTPAARKKLKIPAWATAAKLPALHDHTGKPGAKDAIDEEIARLAFSNPEEPHPLVPTAHERWTAESLGALAWAIFEAWLEDGGDAKQQWALQAVGFWGDDDAARRLTTMAKAWPGQGLGKRAQWAIDALANIGTDAALANINLLAEKSRFPAFKAAAAEKIEGIAADRGLTTDELADRLTPTLDLDVENADVLDFGTRRFRVVFDESLVPTLRDEDGKVLKTPPKPRKSDDEPLAKTEIARFKALKKEAQTAAKLQITRMERTMQEQRPIAADIFAEYFVGHPWMTHLAQRLVWCVATEPGMTFRIAEDGTFATAEDDVFELPPTAAVTVAHPLNVPEETAREWAAVFADYQLQQPFEQLGRAVFHPEPGELAMSSLSRFRGTTTHFSKLRALESRRWYRWMDDSWINGVGRELAPGVDAVLYFDPGWAPGEFAEDIEEQTLEDIELLSDAGGATFADVPGVAFSELVRDLVVAVGRPS